MEEKPTETIIDTNQVNFIRLEGDNSASIVPVQETMTDTCFKITNNEELKDISSVIKIR
jgi:hypothetical protein